MPTHDEKKSLANREKKTSRKKSVCLQRKYHTQIKTARRCLDYYLHVCVMKNLLVFRVFDLHLVAYCSISSFCLHIELTSGFFYGMDIFFLSH